MCRAYAVFVDLEKAFDRVDWKKLMRILKKIVVDWNGRGGGSKVISIRNN